MTSGFLRRLSWGSGLVVPLAGLMLGAALASSRSPVAASEATAAQAAPSASPTARAELNTLRDEVARLKSLTPSQSHAMQDVSYHYTNLWFAGQKANWPLAAFYLDETRSHLKWAVRIIPRRKVSAGEIDLDGMRDLFESAFLADVQQALEAKNVARFATAYKVSLEGCYACHKAAEKPYLRPQVPTQPEVQIINFDPNAAWPQ